MIKYHQTININNTYKMRINMYHIYMQYIYKYEYPVTCKEINKIPAIESEKGEKWLKDLKKEGKKSIQDRYKI